MALHDEKGVAATSVNDVAARAEVGAATVLRHFPDTNALVAACGQHIAAELAPPRPEDAEAMFAGLATADERLERLVRELHAFYARGHDRIEKAEADRSRIEALDAFLNMLDDARRALLRSAMDPDDPDEPLIAALMALSGIGVWKALRDGGFTPAEAAVFHTAVLRRVSTALAEMVSG